MNGDPGFEVQVKQVSTDCKIQGSTKRFLMFLVRSCSRFIVRGPLTLTWLLVRKKATVMLMTWSWRQIWDVDDKIPGISILVTFLSDLISQFGAWRMSKKQVDPCDQNGKNRHQHLKFVINTFRSVIYTNVTKFSTFPKRLFTMAIQQLFEIPNF